MKKLKLLLLGFLLFAGGVVGAQDLVTVSGVVFDSDRNEPLVGASVVAGTGAGMSTLHDGSYLIKVAPGVRLIYQFVGYKPVEFICPANQAKVVHNVKLVPEAQTMDDVVVVAYGVRKKGSIAGSVSTVKSDKLENVPAASFDQAL